MLLQEKLCCDCDGSVKELWNDVNINTEGGVEKIIQRLIESERIGVYRVLFPLIESERIGVYRVLFPCDKGIGVTFFDIVLNGCSVTSRRNDVFK